MQKRLAEEWILIHVGRLMVSGGVSDVKETAALPVGIVPGLGLAHGSGWLVGQPNLTGLGKGSL